MCMCNHWKTNPFIEFLTYSGCCAIYNISTKTVLMGDVNAKWRGMGGSKIISKQ